MFPPKKPGMDKNKPLMLGDDPADDVGKPPHAEPDGDEGGLASLMGEDITQAGDEPLVDENPLKGALDEAGFDASEDQLARIEAILKEPSKPAMDKSAKPMAGKPSVGTVPGGLPPPGA